MSQYYNAQRQRDLYNPESAEPFKLSRSKIDLFVKCSRCFYLDRRLGIGQPPGYPFTLNSAVDALLKKEFDAHRAKNKKHPLMEHYQIDAVPFVHKKMDEWRQNFTGIQAFHQPSNFLVFGAVDDIWINSKNELMIVDYKATSTEKEVTLDEEWKDGYKRQMEIYQWLARHNDDLKKYQISNTGYFVYCNGRRDKEAFDGKLEFDVQILSYQGDDSWVEKKLIEARQCLSAPRMPAPAPDCDFCDYRKAVSQRISESAN